HGPSAGPDGQPRRRVSTSSGIGRACSGSPVVFGRPTHARTSKPCEQTRAPTAISCSMRKGLVFTQATFDRIVSTSPERAGLKNLEPDSTMGTPTMSYLGNASGHGSPSDAKSASHPRSYHSKKRG